MFQKIIFFTILLTFVLSVVASKNFPYKGRNSDDIDVISYAANGKSLVAGRQDPFNDDDALLYRLPGHTVPISYNVVVETWTEMNNTDFTGTVSIELQAITATAQITLHHRQLTIFTATLSQGGTSIPIDSTTYDFITEHLTFNLLSPLTPNQQYTLFIAFSGTLRNDDAGFYLSTYVNDAGETVYLATTQFQATDARHGFPCYDEPALKAHFTIGMTHHPSRTAISNMPVSHYTENAAAGTITTHFEQTPLMSTYLIAYVVSDFQYTSNEHFLEVNLPHRVFARPNAVTETILAVEAGDKLLEEFIQYLNVTFSLPKMDQVALPDFAAGAMENWGLVTYRQEYLLWNDARSNFITKTYILTIIAHEFAHQWFGNLVTPSWWTYLWLNEGFATVYEFYAVDMAYPEMEMKRFFVPYVVHYALLYDANGYTRPMTYAVYAHADIEYLFDLVAYDKSGCVLRMMLHALTEETFVKGLTNYLNTFAYLDVSEEDLYVHLDEAAKEDGTLPAQYNMHDIMMSWSSQSGYPLLIIQRDYLDNTIRITQEYYLNNMHATVDTRTWWIPYNFMTQSDILTNDTSATHWLPQGVRTQTLLPNQDTNNWQLYEWIIFNKQQTGYYRILYDDINYNRIADELWSETFDRIDTETRSQLIDDALNFGQTNRLSYSIVFNLIKYLNRETDYVPWSAAVTGITYINHMFEGTPNSGLFKFFAEYTLSTLFNYIGTEDEGPQELQLRKYARELAIQNSCFMGSAQCLNMATNTLLQHSLGATEIHPNLRNAIFCAGLRTGSAAQFNYLIELMFQTNDEAERIQIIGALGCTSNQALLENLLLYTLSPTDLTPQNRIRVINSVYQRSFAGLELTIQFLTSSPILVNTFIGSGINGIVNGISQRVAQPNTQLLFNNLLNSLIQFNEYISQNTLTTAAANIQTNSNWLARHYGEISQWLFENAPIIAGVNMNIPSTVLMFMSLLLILVKTIV